MQCLRRLADESKADEATVIALWRHEISRIMRDRLSRSTDLLWFDDKLDQALVQVCTYLGSFCIAVALYDLYNQGMLVLFPLEMFTNMIALSLF